MPAPANNNFNPTGRPRDLRREFARLEEAARHIDALVDNAAMEFAIDQQRGTPPSRQFRELAAEITERRQALGGHLQDFLSLVRSAREAVPPAPTGRRRRRAAQRAAVQSLSTAVKIHADPASREIAETAVMLDRLISHLDGRPQ